MNNEIVEGDLVTVRFENCPWLYNMRVIHIPVAAGDSWHLRDSSGRLYYVQSFTSMEVEP